MRIEIQFQDRVGIAHEILAVLARRGLNVIAVEVDPPSIYIDSPDLHTVQLPDLRAECAQVAGVTDLSEIEVLPGHRRRLQLDTMLAAMEDPVLVVDAAAKLVIANAAAGAVTELDEASLCLCSLGEVLGDVTLEKELLHSGFRMPSREVSLHGVSFFMDVTPVAENQQKNQSKSQLSPARGAVLTFHAPSRIGGRLHALQNAVDSGFDTMISVSEVMHGLKLRAARVAVVDAPLLITGETGTGKELLAKACHGVSSRSHAPFLELNCAALPESLAESELFGYMSGAFTGAQRGGRPGLFEMADGGTVFLDEVGEMSLYLQAKLLRFLNDGRFRRIGGEREIKANVRIISATHRNLRKMVADGSFREDLFYRLNVLHLEMPALRERIEDILPLARHFIERACTQSQKPVCRLNAAAAAALQANRWAGNVRQLQNVVFRAITLSDRRILDAQDLDWAEDSIGAEDAKPDAHSWDEAVMNFERSLLERLYPQFPSSRKLAARLHTSHSAVATKLRKYGIPQKS